MPLDAPVPVGLADQAILEVLVAHVQLVLRARVLASTVVPDGANRLHHARTRRPRRREHHVAGLSALVCVLVLFQVCIVA